MPLTRRTLATLMLTTAVVASAAAPVSSSVSSSAAPPVSRAAVAAEKRPDIVFILMDDFSVELIKAMVNARRMARQGADYRNAFVVDSLCCPSRASIFTGQPPHLTGVLTNAVETVQGPLGGYRAFQQNGNLYKSFNVALRRSGYTTGFVGKYMNGYNVLKEDTTTLPPPIIPGWTELEAILKGGYNGWGFWRTHLSRSREMTIKYHDVPASKDPDIDKSYATNVAARDAVDFVRRHRDDSKPYFLEVSVYAPHGRNAKVYPDQPLFPPARADQAPATNPFNGGNCGPRRCRELQLTDLVGYDDPREDNAPTYLREDGSTEAAPSWRTNPISLTAAAALRHYRNRARMVQAVDRLLGRIREAVRPDTYVVLTSDNGFHLGQHQLNGGKGTPYDSDTRVPLVVVGPGVVPGRRDQFISNIDLAPTFEQLAGLRPADSRAGIGFADTLAQPAAPGGRYVFYEHTRVAPLSFDPDLDEGTGGQMRRIPSYIGVRSEAGLLVRFDLDPSWTGVDYAWELYRYDVPWEDVNVFATDHDQPWAVDLMDRLRAWPSCVPDECRAVRR